LSEDDVIHVGDEYVVEHDDEVSGVKIQSIELKTKGRPEEAIAKDVDALWARAIDDVIVKIAVQKGAITESFNHKVSKPNRGDNIDCRVRGGHHQRRAGRQA
jgi:uncharacterized Zn finger protein